MKENFEFEAKAFLPHEQRSVAIRVVVKGTRVTLYGAFSRLCTGIWDSGNYVRYEYSQRLDVHPAILDLVDSCLRQRMTTKGDVARVPPPRASAVGYQG